MDQTLRPNLIPPHFSLYAEKHSVFELYQRLLSAVLQNCPEDPIQFMIDFLKKDVNPHAIVVIGPPSSGKKTLSRLLSKKTGAVLLTPSNLVETMPNNLKLEFNKELISNSLRPLQWAKLIKMRIDDYDCVRKGWILEGFPNNREQAQNILANGIIPKHTIILNGIDSMLIERAAGKRVDSKTGEIYHTTFDWPVENSIQQRLVVPENNSEEDLVNRLIIYQRHIDGITDCFKANSKIINVDQPKGDVFNQILDFVSQTARTNTPITPRIVLIGPAGSGKRTQANALAKKYDIINVSLSSLIKEAIALDNPLGAAIAPYVQKRSKIPDSLLLPLLKERLSKLDAVTRGWVLHGFPKTYDQAESLAQNGFSPNRVFFMDIPNDSIIERITLRYLDPISGERYHMLFNPPPTQDIRERLIQKPSDNEQNIRIKINEYYASIRDMVDYYETVGMHINADQDPNTVFESLESKIVNSAAESLSNF